MYIEEICAAAEAMSGIDAETLEGAAAAAEAELLSKLRPDVEASSVEARFITAGALLTLAVHMAAGAADGVSSFSAGNMSATMAKGSRESGIAMLRAQAEAILSDALSDDAFAFLGVDG